MSTHGARNLITDVPGLKIGQAEDLKLRSGVTVLVPDEPCVCAVDVRGGAPGTRETDALNPTTLVGAIHAVCLAGGSVFGLDAASGVVAALSAAGKGLRFSDAHPPVPVVPAAILFDLVNGGDKSWGAQPPYRDLGWKAAHALSLDFKLGTAGAGTGAQVGTLKGGIGSASADAGPLGMIGSLVAVNAVGSAVVPGTSTLWAAPLAHPGELGKQDPIPPESCTSDWPADAKIPLNTTIGAIALEADLTRAEAQRIAIMAHDGLARAIRPIHTPFDGDSIFVMAMGKRPLGPDRPRAIAKLGAIAADCLSRAVARGVYEAASLGAIKSYRETFGR